MVNLIEKKPIRKEMAVTTKPKNMFERNALRLARETVWDAAQTHSIILITHTKVLDNLHLRLVINKNLNISFA